MDRRSARQPFGNSEREDVDPCASLAAVDGGTHEIPLAIDDGRHFYVELAIVDPFVLHAVWQPHDVIGLDRASVSSTVAPTCAMRDRVNARLGTGE